MPQLNRNISVFQIETDIDKKYLKTRNKKYRYRSHLIYPHVRPSSSYVCVHCMQSKSMSGIKYKGSCILLWPVCANHPKILISEKLSSPLGLFDLRSFHEFVILFGRMESISCVVFYLVIKVWEVLKTY